MEWENVDAVLLDLDGVLTPTAEVHMRAWATLFTGVLEDLPEGDGDDVDTSPYTDEDYFEHVDGRPRYEGVAAFLGSRGIELPHGTPDDAPDAATVCGLGNRKNVLFNELLDAEGIEPYPGSVALLDHLQDRGTAVAVVTSSRNGPHVLDTSGLAERFEVVVDGTVAAEQGLAGKPEPDTYRYAAERLGTDPSRCAVVEDAVSGVQSGAAGSFGVVVGVDRGVGADALRSAGADVVVTDLAELLPREQQDAWRDRIPARP
ncbi:HAD family hydrolase [Ornithinimicrobium pekingense]|uniref:Haloacid dehalogenase n=1 Tax=Ornithinimicrobium pekingense TaxID=384677 RepID=A0ABQ2F711_9MICO|nr:HAD-IA family hydrolase [Ornithinimicrobium pekingense]GGK67622.1 haloacid dehalogenase [Ornithinimicrobium pekingense]